MGGTSYDVSIRIVSGFDGFVPEAEGDDAGREARIAGLMETLDRMSEQEIENDVFQEIEFTLCPDCRKRFVAELSDYLGDQDAPKSKKSPILLQ
ncbi:MAG: hypothetical protein IT350_18545 [Deltaproteobacteria bacterium]|nr:hypothetical protein [Deltaproteobacteria bacterium]